MSRDESLGYRGSGLRPMRQGATEREREREREREKERKKERKKEKVSE